jgi:phosphate transport system permease protein
MIEMKLNVPPYGVGIFTSSIILAIMILPFSVSLSRQVISMVPDHLKEAAYSLGATRFEVITKIIIPYTKSGLFAGLLLALGRALGETMAVTMLIGNTHSIPTGIFSPGNTMASIIANEFSEATGKLYTSALIEMGLFLFVVATVINVIGKQIIKRFTL